MTHIKTIKNLITSTEDLARIFIAKYFPEQVDGEDTYWIADVIVGGAFFVSDFFFGIDRMVEALELDASFEQLCDYYEAQLEWGLAEEDKPFPVNFKNYVKYGMELPSIPGEKI